MIASFVLDPAHGPLSERLYHAVRAAISRGALSPGQRLPSTRALGRELRLSRNTVAEAFRRLAAEGYIGSRHGSGTFVAGRSPEPAPLPFTSSTASPSRGQVVRTDDGRIATHRALHPARLSHRGRSLLAAEGPPAERSVAFRMSLPALEAFPRALWGKLAARRWDRAPAVLFTDHDERGHAPLRAAIADYLVASRGVRCDADHVLIVAGAQQAFGLIASVVCDPGDEVWMEDPGYPPARAAVMAAGALPRPIPVDAGGLDVDEAIHRAPSARLAVVTPSHQFPLAGVLSAPRRHALLDWARRSGAWILEDDYDSELRYAGPPVPALQGLEPDAPVALVGTFSKVLGPWLRLGYIVAPDALLDALVAARRTAGIPPIMNQAVVADFIRDGHFLRHVRRLRVLYDHRRATLERHAAELLDGRAHLRPIEAGLHAILDLPAGSNDRTVGERAASAGVVAMALSRFRHQVETPPALLLGFATVPAREQARALAVIASSL